MMSRITAITLALLDVSCQSFVSSLPAVFERVEDDVGRDRRAPEDLVANRIRNRIHDGAVCRADRRLADAANASGRFGIREIHTVAVEVERRVENRRRLVLIETARQRDAVLL